MNQIFITKDGATKITLFVEDKDFDEKLLALKAEHGPENVSEGTKDKPDKPEKPDKPPKEDETTPAPEETSAPELVVAHVIVI